MTHDLACLPLWYADRRDLVYTPEPIEPEFIRKLPFNTEILPSLFGAKDFYRTTEVYKANPWGISPSALRIFKQIKDEGRLNLIIPEWDEKYRILTGRQTTIRCHQQIKELYPDLEIPDTPLIFKRGIDLEKHLAKTTLPVVLKAPYSSSGRGIVWITNPSLSALERNWIAGILKRQGFISLEKGLEKTLDFAMEFYSDGNGGIRYEGLSVFNTEKGSYSGNELASQKALQKRIEDQAGQALSPIRKVVSQTLEKIYGSDYTGHLGVDILLYRKNGGIHIHPCVEVNMRFTMGLTAIRLYEQFIHPDAKGFFYITFHKTKQETWDTHQRLQKTHPLLLQDGKIRKGYLSLCPVNKQTHYRAYILLS